MALWQAGRDAWQRLLGSAEARYLVWKLSRSMPDRGTLGEAARLTLIHRLLDRTRNGDAGPVVAPDQAPAFERILNRGYAVRFEPLLHRVEAESHEARRERSSQALETQGRRFRTLRRLEDITIAGGPAKGVNSSVLVENYQGDTHVHPAQDLPDVVTDGVFKPRDRLRFEAAGRHVEVPLEPPAEDLVLLLEVWGLWDSSHVVLELLGREATLPLVFSLEDASRFQPGPPSTRPAGYALRVRRALLPEGLRTMRLRLVGLQPIGRIEPAAHVARILQQVAGPPLDSLADGVFAALPAPADEAQRRLHFEAAAAPLRAARRARPDDLEPLLALAKTALEAELPGEAERFALRYLERRRGSAVAVAHNLLGDALAAQGDPARAIEEWWRGYEIDPAGKAGERLREHAPEQLAEVHRVADAEEFLAVAMVLRDFRRAEEVDRALASFNIQKGTAIGLGPENWEPLLADMVRHGVLARAGGPPSGRGAFHTDDEGRVISTVHGRREAPRQVPPALTAPRGFRVTPEVLLAALDQGGENLLEVVLPRLRPADLDHDWARIARAAAGVEDPWAVDALLRAARSALDRGPAARLLPLEPALRHIHGHAPEPRQRWGARWLLQELGVRDLGPLPSREVGPLMTAVFYNQLPVAVLAAALETLEGGARPALLEALRSQDMARVVSAARLLPRFGRREDAALLAPPARDGVVPEPWTGVLRRALESMLGTSLEDAPETWPAGPGGLTRRKED